MLRAGFKDFRDPLFEYPHGILVTDLKEPQRLLASQNLVNSDTEMECKWKHKWKANGTRYPKHKNANGNAKGRSGVDRKI